MPTIGLDVKDLTLALANAKVGVWKWLLEDGLVIWSPEVFEIFRVDASKFEGRVTFDAFKDRIHLDDLDMVLGSIEAAMQNRGEFHVEHRLRLEGEVRWVRGQGRALLNQAGEVIGMTGASLDITDQRQSFEELAQATERYRLYSELGSDYIYSVDLLQSELTPFIVAGSFERITGYTAAEVAELGGWASVVHEDDREVFPALILELQKGLPIVNEYRVRTKSGEIRWLRDRVRPVLSDSGELIAVEGGVQDISERKSLMAQLMHAHKMEALAHLAGSVAHDFNNLLTVMFAASGLVRTQTTGLLASEALDALDTATERAADLSRSLLTFSRRQVAIRNPRHIKDLLDGAMPILRRATGEKIDIVLEDDSDGIVVAIDASQIQLALLNLVVNARDAMPEGGTITIKTGQMSWQPGDPGRPAGLMPGSYAFVAVHDTGTGITNEVMAHLFEPFFTTKEVGSGTGLGLAAVHGVVRNHEGDIEVKSERGVGTSFTLYFPKSEAVAPSAPPVRRDYAIGGTEKVLVVEDDPLVRSVTVASLEDLGYQVVHAASAEEGLLLVDGVDLVLSDVRLPKMPGTELALLIAAQWPDKPVILMSGLVEDDQQKAVVESAQFAFLPKPFTQVGLAKRLREALGDK